MEDGIVSVHRVDESGVMEVVCLWVGIVVLSVGVIDVGSIDIRLLHEVDVTDGDCHVADEVVLVIGHCIKAWNC